MIGVRQAEGYLSDIISKRHLRGWGKKTPQKEHTTSGIAWWSQI
jgi:hypothetical protein